MKIIHTSDWHLGKKLFKVSRLSEQEKFLEWLLAIIKEQTIDVLIIAGDIYDTPNPPAEAIKLFYNFLHHVSSDTQCHCLIISGNHDSGPFIEAPKNLLSDKKIEIVGKLVDNKLPSTLISGVEFHFLPFFRSYEILKLAKELEIEHDEEGALILNTIDRLIENGKSDSAKHRFLIAHHIFGNMERVEMGGSEQVISLSGLDSIPNSLLEKHYDYVALGHIHKKATLKNDTPIIRYSGAPLPFRFSERFKKSITIIDTEGDKLSHSEIEVPQFRELISIRTTFEDLNQSLDQLKEKLNDGFEHFPPLLEVQLSSKDPQLGIADFIRDELKEHDINLLSFRTVIEGRVSEQEEEVILRGIPEMDELFEMFYFSKHPESEKIPEIVSSEFKNLLSEVLDCDEVTE